MHEAVAVARGISWARVTAAVAVWIAVSGFAGGTGGCARDAGTSGTSGAVGRDVRPQPAPQPAPQSAPQAGDTRPVLKQGGDVPPQPARLDRPDPPLVQAARGGDAKRVRSLLDAGADVNAFGNARVTALMAAAEAGNEEVARVLVDRRADANLRNAKGQTAAEVADAAGHTRLRALLEGTEVKPPPGPANPIPAK